MEVIDLRTVAPLDLGPVLESVHKTSRLLVAHEAVVPFGIGAEIAATVGARGLLGPRRPDPADRCGRDPAPLCAEPRAGVAPWRGRRRRGHPAARRDLGALELSSPARAR